MTLLLCVPPFRYALWYRMVGEYLLQRCGSQSTCRDGFSLNGAHHHFAFAVLRACCIEIIEMIKFCIWLMLGLLEHTRGRDTVEAAAPAVSNPGLCFYLDSTH